jgi:hypothetical protein
MCLVVPAVVDQRVETPPGGCGRDDLPAILIARHIALDHDRFATRRAANIGGLFGFLLAGGIVDHNARAAFGQHGRGRRPQAGRRAGNNRAQAILRHPHFLM